MPKPRSRPIGRPADAAQADHAERPVAQLAAHVARALVPSARADEAILDPHVVRQRDHPADGRLGHRAVDGARGDEDDDVGRGAGRDVHRVVADAEPADGQQVVGLGRPSRP